MAIDPLTYELAKDPAFLELGKLLKGITTVVQQQSQTIGGLRTLMETTAAKAKEVVKEVKEEPEDLEEMSKKDLADLILGKVGSLLETKLTEMGTKMDGALQKVNNRFISDDVTKFAGDTKDFKDWEGEMGALAKGHPTLSIKDLYALAKAQNPDKVKEVDTKYADKTTKDDARLQLFGGFRPTTNGDASGSGDGKEAKKMTVDEALEKSWEEATASFPALARMGDDAVD